MVPRDSLALWVLFSVPLVPSSSDSYHGSVEDPAISGGGEQQQPQTATVAANSEDPKQQSTQDTVLCWLFGGEQETTLVRIDQRPAGRPRLAEGISHSRFSHSHIPLHHLTPPRKACISRRHWNHPTSECRYSSEHSWSSAFCSWHKSCNLLWRLPAWPGVSASVID